MKKIAIIVGTRPNFIKISQFPKAFLPYKDIFEYKIVHTGQHFDEKMAQVFFNQFNLSPDVFLNIDAKTPNSQIAQIMLKLEEFFTDYKPHLVIVVGDVNSTLAGALTANKMNLKLAHLESGLRSGDNTMPEESNRILTDHISDFYFVTEQSGLDNLKNEGKDSSKIFFVGNTMIDTLVAFKEKVAQASFIADHKLMPGEFVLMTMHRPATVDEAKGLQKLLEVITQVTLKYKIVFPIHPRTLKCMKEAGLEKEFTSNTNLILTQPLDYFSFQSLIVNSKFVLTDSGGIQEESTYYGVPCLTLRPNTERPSTVNVGTNELVPFVPATILEKVGQIEKGNFKKGKIPPLWDGKTSERIAEIISKLCLTL